MPWTKFVQLPLSVGLATVVASIFTSLIVRPATAPSEVVKALLLHGIALSTSAALYSLRVQALGLIGDNGVLPLTNTLHTIRRFLAMSNTSSYISEESVMKGLIRLVLEKFQPAEGDTKQLTNILNFDFLISIIAVVWPHPVLLTYLYISYYGYKRICGPFLNFQWDALLLESLLLSIPLALANTPVLDFICLWLFRILLFRLMFGSGVVKAYGKDESWYQSYDAMSYHFLTQPLPNYLGMIIHTSLSQPWFGYMTCGSLVAEVILPLFGLVGWSVFDKIVAGGTILLMLSIVTTGYFGFFNILTMVLCLCLLQDNDIWTALSSFLSPPTMKNLKQFTYAHHGNTHTDVVNPWRVIMQMLSMFLCSPVVVVIAVVQVVALVKLLHRTGWIVYATDKKQASEVAKESPEDPNSPSLQATSFLERSFHRFLSPFHDFCMTTFYLGSHYGLFANMTKRRDEIIVEIKVDEKNKVWDNKEGNNKEDDNWEQIKFNYKPDDIYCPPKPIVPFFHLPRLDWMMWFLALRPSAQFYPKWFWNFMLSLGEGDNDDVIGLLHNDGQLVLRTRQLEALQQDKDLYFRLTLYRYDFHKQRPLVEADFSFNKAETEMKTIYKRQYWTREKVTQLMPPLNKDGLFMLFEQYDGRNAEQGRQKREKPTVETAAEVILRTLFRKKQELRKQQQETKEIEASDQPIDG